MRKMLMVLLGLSTFAGAQGGAPLSDQDGDGLPWAVETALGLDPASPDTDGDQVPDGTEACAAGGDGRNQEVLERGEGARIVVWREDLRAWAFLIYRVTNYRGRTLRVYAPGLGRLPVEGLLQPCASGTDGTQTLQVEFPSGALEALGGNWLWDGRVQGDLGYPVAGSLLQRPEDRRWLLVEQDAKGRFRSVPAEVRALSRFPVSGYHPGPRTCVQVSQRVGPGGDLGYSRYLVVDENCRPQGPECVFDCGQMIGATFLWFTDPRR